MLPGAACSLARCVFGTCVLKLGMARLLFFALVGFFLFFLTGCHFFVCCTSRVFLVDVFFLVLHRPDFFFLLVVSVLVCCSSEYSM